MAEDNQNPDIDEDELEAKEKEHFVTSSVEDIMEEEDELEFFNDVPLVVSAELGRLDITIRDLIRLDQGSVVELDKLAGEPLEILINDRLISRGEVIVINEKYGIRLTDIVSPSDGEGNNKILQGD